MTPAAHPSKWTEAERYQQRERDMMTRSGCCERMMILYEPDIFYQICPECGHMELAAPPLGGYDA